MENILKTNVTDLATQGGKIAAGATEHALTIALGDNTAAKITTDVVALTNVIMAVGAGKTELSNRQTAVRNTVVDGRLMLTAARDSFKPNLGYQHNLLWNETGLTNSLAIPERELAVLPLLNSFKAFLTTHPTLEVPDKNITADRAEQLYNALDNAGIAVNSQRAAVGQLMLNRGTKEKQLRTRLRGTINTLKQVLGPLDPRWASFGLNQPGLKATPDAPAKLIVALLGPNAATLRWNAAPRADYYRVWKKVSGVDQDMVAVGSPADLDFLIQNLPAGSTIEIAVSAINNGGESALSGIVTVQTA